MINYFNLLDILKKTVAETGDKNPLMLLLTLENGIKPLYLCFRELVLYQYEEDKLIQKKEPPVRVAGNPPTGEETNIYLSISSHATKDTALDVKPFVKNWINYLECLPEEILGQTVLVYNPDSRFYGNLEVVCKGGIGYSRFAACYSEKRGTVQIAGRRREGADADNAVIIDYARSNNELPFLWGECVVLNRDMGTSMVDKSLFNPANLGVGVGFRFIDMQAMGVVADNDNDNGAEPLVF